LIYIKILDDSVEFPSIKQVGISCWWYASEAILGRILEEYVLCAM
jgi:hypothetical protein